MEKADDKSEKTVDPKPTTKSLVEIEEEQAPSKSRIPTKSTKIEKDEDMTGHKKVHKAGHFINPTNGLALDVLNGKDEEGIQVNAMA